MISGDSIATFSASPDSLPIYGSGDVQDSLAPRNLGGYTAAVVVKLREFAPYAAIELILPGGSLIALFLWFYRRHKRAVFSPTH